MVGAHRGNCSTWTSHPALFLPPECQNAVVLQATVGHSGGVGFGGSAATGAHTRSTDEFDQHTTDVAALWGRRLLQSRVLFLAGSDLLNQPIEKIVAQLEAIGRTFPIEPRSRGRTADRADEDEKPRFDGVHAFINNFASPRPDPARWRELAARGVVRISLGVESGDPKVRSLYSR